MPCGVQVVEDLLCGLGDLGLGGDLVPVDADGDFLEWPQLTHESFEDAPTKAISNIFLW